MDLVCMKCGWVFDGNDGRYICPKCSSGETEEL